MTTLNFKSDNEAPAHPTVLEALVKANEGFATAYAEDSWSKMLDEAFSQYFDHSVQVLPLATGTAANSITLGSLSPPWGAVFCHPNAHINNDEGGAPEFYTDGAKLTLIDGDNAKISAGALDRTIRQAGAHGVHNVKPAVVSITQATECGTAYTPSEIEAISKVTRQHHLPLHMDGARFSNALAYLGCQPADITWRAGIDVLSYGGTKNGAMDAEAIIVFGDHPDWIEGMHRRRKRGGHLLSKMRYVSAQLLALIDNNLATELACCANEKAQRLAQGLEATGKVSLKWPVEANEVFIEAEDTLLTALKENGIHFHRWPGYEGVARLVCTFETSDEQVDTFIDYVKRLG